MKCCIKFDKEIVMPNRNKLYSELSPFLWLFVPFNILGVLFCGFALFYFL